VWARAAIAATIILASGHGVVLANYHHREVFGAYVAFSDFFNSSPPDILNLEGYIAPPPLKSCKDRVVTDRASYSDRGGECSENPLRAKIPLITLEWRIWSDCRLKLGSAKIWFGSREDRAIYKVDNTTGFVGWSNPRIFPLYREMERFDPGFFATRAIEYPLIKRNPGTLLDLGSGRGNPISVRCCVGGNGNRLVGLGGEQKSVEEKPRTDRDQDSLVDGIISHLLSRFIHPLLRSKIVQFSLLGTLFAALAGLGGGLILDNFNRKPKRRVFGWCLLAVCLPLAVFSLALLSVYG
jgi:hypothetical protein